MAAIGQLTLLTQLRLEGNRVITQQGLMQLTGLKQLQQLAIGGDCTQHVVWCRVVTEETVEQLWAALHQRA
jgi:hypothetical protein